MQGKQGTSGPTDLARCINSRSAHITMLLSLTVCVLSSSSVYWVMEEFFQAWLGRQEQLLEELLSTRNRPERDDRLRELGNAALAHYEAYYREKTRLADRDVLLVYSPAWLTPYERTFLWIAGFRPFLAFRLLKATLDDAERSPEQALAIEELEAEVAEEERKLTRKMASLQEVMATPQVLAMVRRLEAARNGENQPDEEDVVGPVLRSLRGLLGCADKLRVRVAKRLVEILRPAQMVDLLVAATQLHLRIRAWGMRRENAAVGAAGATARSYVLI